MENGMPIMRMAVKVDIEVLIMVLNMEHGSIGIKMVKKVLRENMS